MADFNAALPYVILNEGKGYEEQPRTDQPTNTGIIASDIAEWKKLPISQITKDMVKSLSPDEINSIYKALYWDKIRGDEITDQGMATCLFDTCVNRGLATGIIYAQRTCNLLGGSLVADGVFGSYTLAAVNNTDRSKFIKTFENLEAAAYLAIVAAKPEDKRFLQGWQSRAKRLFTLI